MNEGAAWDEEIFGAIHFIMWGLKLTTHLQLVLRSRKCGSIHPPPPYVLVA
ncbi:hypothetical protein B7P43_G12651 [Cryptotermes secundus]|uniref:Uncharacterized protein n=1 Tax=Cryptotermes secundus TaxID=105785 RepID=A0A2J7QRR6_9NEOP|nr:hypothetical protein B7P43_G12651 [Cryptotermes secundus]